MPKKPIDPKVERLKALKSAYILEADASMARGSDAAAMELFVKAGEMELQLAALRSARHRPVSLFSAGSCFLRAKQYRQAMRALEQVVDEIPEARELMAVCEGKEDLPIAGTAAGLQALVELLVKRKVITPDEWAGALAAHG